MKDEQKRYNIRIVNRETLKVETVDALGYSLQAVLEDDGDGFVAGNSSGGIDTMQLAILIDALIEAYPELMGMMTFVAKNRGESTVVKGDPEFTKKRVERIRKEMKEDKK